MLDFVKRAFHGFFDALLWINLLGCAVGGAILGGVGSGGRDGGYMFWGLVVGVIVGILANIIGGGLIATFLSMDERLRRIDENLGLLTVPIKQQQREVAKQRTAPMKQRQGEEAKQRFKESSDYFTDPRDGQEYRIVNIGGKTWMAQNLNYAPETGNSWCYGDNNSNGDEYGRLYDWNTAKTVSPAGWHLPTRQEWIELVSAVGGDSVAGRALKAATGWYENGGGEDGYDFFALPGGLRYPNGAFDNLGKYGYWWTATEYGANAYFRFMSYDSGRVGEERTEETLGFSVRCVKDDVR